MVYPTNTTSGLRSLLFCRIERQLNNKPVSEQTKDIKLWW